MTDAVVTQGHFKTYNGNVFYNYELIIHRMGENKAAIAMNVRANMVTTAQKDFDAILFDLIRNNVEIEYADSFSKRFNTDSQVTSFLISEDVTTNAAFDVDHNIGMTPEEITAAILFRQQKKDYDALVESIKAKFRNRFSAPRLPYTISPRIDVENTFGNEADYVLRWMNDPSLSNNRVTVYGDHNRNLIRVGATGKRIETLANEYLGIKSAERIARKALDCWRTGNVGHGVMTIRHGSYSHRSLDVHNDRIVLGCQTICRSEVERMSELMGWDKEIVEKSAEPVDTSTED